jgi:predicted HTH transcriptional regulator
MALPVNIDDLINHRKVEWARIEYKEGWNPEKVLHTLCAFANDIDNWGGGYVIIGIAEENGRPVFPVKGIDPNEVDVIQKELLNVCHLIEPVYLPVVEPCVDKPDPTGEGMVEQTFRGPLHVQLRSALDYIRNRFLREKIFKYDDRPEAGRFWNYPYRAIEEVLANAVYHKSYRIAEPITVVVTPEAMTISSLPGPERSITDADLAACRMIGLHYRNRRIGDFLKELDLVEGRNTGIPVVVNVMRENGSPPPVFSSPENRDWLSVILPVNPHFRKMEDPISERTALKTALTSQRGTHKEEGEERDKLVDSGRVVEVMTAEEELAHIKVALKTALIHRSAKVVERMGILLQQLLRDKDTTIVA